MDVQAVQSFLEIGCILSIKILLNSMNDDIITLKVVTTHVGFQLGER